MVDDLIAALSRFWSFAVIGRRPAFARKGYSADPQELAQELNVRYLLEGSVRRGGNRLRLVAKLLDGVDGATLWVETFEGALEDIFDFQDRITRNVAAVVEPQIQRAELERGRRERPASMTAYDLYLRALAQMYAHTAEANAAAFSLMQKALDIEPDNDAFLALASWALEYRTSVGWPPLTVDDRALCVDLAHRALRVAGDNARVLSNCGNAIQSMGGEFERGQLIVNRAVMLNPNDVAVLHTGGVSHLLGGDLNEGLRLLRRAIEIQPNHAYEAMGIAAAICVALGRYMEALDLARRGIAINDKYLVNYWAMAASAAHLGLATEASAAVAQIEALSPGSTIERLRNAFNFKDPQRPVNMVDGLRLAGLPER